MFGGYRFSLDGAILLLSEMTRTRTLEDTKMRRNGYDTVAEYKRDQEDCWWCERIRKLVYVEPAMWPDEWKPEILPALDVNPVLIDDNQVMN